MHSRRQFLRTATLGAASATVLSGLLQGQGPAPQAAPFPGSPGTLTAGYVDLHSHWFSPSSVEILSKRKNGPRFALNEKGERYLDRGGPPASKAPRMALGDQWFDIDARLRHLESTGVAHQLVSWPTTLDVDADIEPAEARELWSAYNKDLAGVIAAHPDRLSGVAALATGDVAWSATELERAHTSLGLIGGVLPVNGFATLEGARAFAPIFEVAQKHRSLIYLHTGYANPAIPGQPPKAHHDDAASARGALDNAWNFAAATITLAYTDFLDSYPDVTVQVAQLGGSGAVALVAEAARQNGGRGGAGAARERWRNIYLDTGAGGRGPEAIGLAVRVLGAERIVLGTDYAPQPSVAPVIENIRKSPLSGSDRGLIFSQNGRAILRSKGVKV